ncbi:HEAT repeat domain-containing protein [Geodermatophilus sabuli]|uniref:HEAT repeat domain-containing protein n=1 Tax=Geodermatophilus sabuli TaxID=1564158 RepID=A0A7K3VV89_9ACTN|nr:HEAT repeat domain-containing protein [Geodermatophilus sabuli]NEK56549.1 HEAT repeat domain-containing protein [Geodermatophilus sabuli]
MPTPTGADVRTRLRSALSSPVPSARLQAVLAAGTHPDPGQVDALVERCAVEPDFYVRDVLTWSLTRHPASATVPRLLEETRAAGRQARSQALHTLSKVGDPRGWTAVTRDLLHDADDEVARSAWRAAVVLVPDGSEAELAAALATQLGRGGRDVQLSLSRALAALGDAAGPVLTDAARDGDAAVRAHAIATERLVRDPDEGFDAAIAEARRVLALQGAPTLPAGRADR